MFTEQFGLYVIGDGTATISCEVDGFTITARVEHDPQYGEPWKAHDGHGPVSEWTSRQKAAGERVLNQDRDSYRYYDFAEAVKIARRDGWGSDGDEGLSPKVKAARAAERDFEVLKAWCDDEWYWCGVVLSVSRNGVELTDHAASLWGVECNYPDSDNSYLTEVANELLDEALEEGRAIMAKLLAA